MTKHTRGPWHVSQHGHFVRHTQSDFTAPNICAVAQECPERRANAALIAAAPELLEACKRLQRELRDGEITIGAEEDVAAAIAKAEGS